MRVSTIESTGAGFLAQPAEDAFGEIDVVARGAASAVGALLGLDRDRKRRANAALAQLAGDAALLGRSDKRRRACSPRKRGLIGVFLLGKLHRDLAPEEMASGERHALRQLDQQNTLEEFADFYRSRNHQIFHGVCIHTAITTSHTSVAGMNTFQPSRMIWS